MGAAPSVYPDSVPTTPEVEDGVTREVRVKGSVFGMLV